MKLTVFRSESTGAALSQWAKSARMKHSHSQDYSHERVAPHEHHHIGILGLTKDYNDHGNLVNITPGTRLHHGRGHADHHEGHKHSKEAARHHHPHHHAHLHKQGTQSIFIFPLLSLFTDGCFVLFRCFRFEDLFIVLLYMWPSKVAASIVRVWHWSELHLVWLAVVLFRWIAHSWNIRALCCQPTHQNRTLHRRGRALRK